MEWPFRCSAWLARLKHAEGYCAATRGEKGRGWLMRWLPSLAHDTARSWFSVTKWESMTTRFRTGTAMIRDPPCGASRALRAVLLTARALRRTPDALSVKQMED